MKRVIGVLGVALAIGLSGQADAQTLKTVRDRGALHLRCQPGSAGLFQPGRQGQLDRLRRRFLPRHRGGDLQRSDQGEVHAVVRPGPVRAAPVGRDRPALAQHHLDQLARCVVQFRGRGLLRRPGLHGAQGAQGEFSAGAQRRQRVRPERHHHRAQSRGLFPRQQHEIRSGRVRNRGRDHQGLRVPAAATRSPPTCRSSIPRSSS